MLKIHEHIYNVTLFHSSYLKVLKNVKFFNEDKVCQEDLEIPFASGKKSRGIGRSAEEVKIVYLEALIKEKDQVIYNQKTAIRALQVLVCQLKQTAAHQRTIADPSEASVLEPQHKEEKKYRTSSMLLKSQISAIR